MNINAGYRQDPSAESFSRGSPPGMNCLRTACIPATEQRSPCSTYRAFHRDSYTSNSSSNLWWEIWKIGISRAPDKVLIFIFKMPISSLNPVFDHLLESSHPDDSNKWSKIGFGKYITHVELIKVYLKRLIWSSAYQGKLLNSPLQLFYVFGYLLTYQIFGNIMENMNICSRSKCSHSS